MNVFFSRLDEQQRRWYTALEAQRLGHGGATLVSQITGIHVATIRRGQEELEKDLESRPVDRVRLPGGGRKRIEEQMPTIVPTLESVVEDSIGGDPMGTKIWVSHSLRHLSQALYVRGYSAGWVTIGRLLRDLDYSLQANCKRSTGDPHPDRDLQFRYIARIKRLFWEAGYPVISVDVSIFRDFRTMLYAVSLASSGYHVPRYCVAGWGHFPFGPACYSRFAGSNSRLP